VESTVNLIALEAASPDAIEVPVLKVFDGDGFLTRIRPDTDDLFERSETEIAVRFGFIDAPELGQPGGVEAREFLLSLIGDQTVFLAILTKMDTGSSFDRYRRLVCVPYLRYRYEYCGLVDRHGRRQHVRCLRAPYAGVFRNIEIEMLLHGWAWVLERYGPDPRYVAALEEARRRKRGIWQSDGNIPPWEFKRAMAMAARRKAADEIPRLTDGSPRPG